MADVTSALGILKFIAPQFAAEDEDDVLQPALDLAAEDMSTAAWGSLYHKAQANLAAHLLVMRQRASEAGSSGLLGSATGPVKSISEGGVSISFGGSGSASGSAGDEALSQTSYGQEYLNLRGYLVGGPIVV